MHHHLASLKAFTPDEDGVTAIEYGLIAALIAVVITLRCKPWGRA